MREVRVEIVYRTDKDIPDKGGLIDNYKVIPTDPDSIDYKIRELVDLIRKTGTLVGCAVITEPGIKGSQVVDAYDTTTPEASKIEIVRRVSF